MNKTDNAGYPCIDILTGRRCRVHVWKIGNYVAIIQYEDGTRTARTARQLQEVAR